jgi:hypothetical protein
MSKTEVQTCGYRFGNKPKTFWYRSWKFALLRTDCFDLVQNSFLLDVGTFVERLWNVCGTFVECLFLYCFDVTSKEMRLETILLRKF